MTMAVTPAGQGTKGSSSPASFLTEREPSVEQLINERDPVALDAAFYTGLGYRLARQIQRELDLDRIRLDVNRYERLMRGIEAAVKAR